MGVYQSAKVWTIDAPTKLKPRSVRPRFPQRTERPERTERPTRRPADERKRAVRNAKFAVWARLIGVAILAVGMLAWPYDRSCGAGLAWYLGAAAMIIVGGVWVVACTWIVRMPRTHAVAIFVTLWGLGMIFLEVLPRVGYAIPDSDQQAYWSCDG